MAKCDVCLHLRDHTYCKSRISNHQTGRAVRPGASRGQTCCKTKQKKKRSSKLPPPPPPPAPADAEPPLEVVSLSRDRSSPIPPEDLPVASPVPPSPPPSRPDDQLVSTAEDPDGPLMIHNHSVEEYQLIYHEVVDPLLRNKSKRVWKGGLSLGHLVKQKLKERLNRPPVTEE